MLSPPLHTTIRDSGESSVTPVFVEHRVSGVTNRSVSFEISRERHPDSLTKPRDAGSEAADALPAAVKGWELRGCIPGSGDIQIAWILYHSHFPLSIAGWKSCNPSVDLNTLIYEFKSTLREAEHGGTTNLETVGNPHKGHQPTT